MNKMMRIKKMIKQTRMMMDQNGEERKKLKKRNLLINISHCLDKLGIV